MISKESGNEKIRIEKKVLSSIGESGYSKSEKLRVEYELAGQDFGIAEIRKKPLLKRIGKVRIKRFQIAQKSGEITEKVLSSEELTYLLNYPNSRIILDRSKLTFKTQMNGKLREQLKNIYDAILVIKSGILEK